MDSAANPFKDMSLNDGIACQRSQVKIVDITDGTSNTYLAGEKYLCPDYYYNALDGTDDQTLYCGDDWDINRWTGTTANQPLTAAQLLPPLPDTPGLGSQLCFGSAHSVGFNMALCDGSVRMINYTIDPFVHDYLGSRNDGVPVNGKNL